MEDVNKPRYASNRGIDSQPSMRFHCYSRGIERNPIVQFPRLWKKQIRREKKIKAIINRKPRVDWSSAIQELEIDC